MGVQVDVSPRSDWHEPPMDDPPTDGDPGPSLFADVAAFLDGGLPEPPPRVVCTRDDGERLFYAGQVNYIFGDPESGKTFLALAATAEALRRTRRAAVVDMDHNGLGATLTRLMSLGAPLDALRSPDRFLYLEPEDAQHLVDGVAALREWRPAVVVVDSMGELLPLLGLSSNQPDDFTVAHGKILKPLAMAGASVLAIDHLAKNADSRAAGPTGTNAKRRAIGGVSLRVSVTEPFTPGHGGRASLLVHKDRHGGLRAVCPIPEGREAFAGTFVLEEHDGTTTWRIHAPTNKATDNRVAADADALDHLDPPPSSVADVRRRMPWGTDRARVALAEWRTRVPSLCVESQVRTSPGGTAT